MNVGACAVCANTEVDLIHIDNGNLRDLYNNVCGFQTEFVNGPPSYMCRLCASLIKKFNNFQDQCQASIQGSQELFTAIQENRSLTVVIDRSNVCVLPNLSYAQPEKLVYEETETVNSSIKKVSQPIQKRNPIPSFKIDVPSKSGKSSNEATQAVASIKNEMDKDWTSEIANNNLRSSLKPDLIHDLMDTDFNEINESIQVINAENSANGNKKCNLENGFEGHITQNVLSDKNIIKSTHIDVNDILTKDDSYVQEFIQSEKKFENSMNKNGLIQCEKKFVTSMDKYVKLVPMNKNDAMAAYEIKLSIKDKENKKKLKKLFCNICKCEIYSHNTMSHYLSHEQKNSCAFCQICKVHINSMSLGNHNDWYHNFKYICKICSEVNFSIPDASQHFVSYHRIEKDEFKVLINEYRIKEKIGKNDRAYANKACVKTNKQDTYVYFSKILSKFIRRVRKQKSRKTEVKKGRIVSLGKLGSHFTRILCTPEEQYQAMLDRKKSFNYKMALYKCELCYRVFLREEKLFKHIKEQHSPSSGRYKCDFCKKYYLTRPNLIKHLRNRHDYRYQCKVCDFKTYNRTVAFTHRLKHLQHKVTCDNCGREFNTRQAMYTHKRYAHPSMAVCSLCGEGFGTQNGVIVHRKFSHKTPLEKEQIERLEKERDSSSELYCQECDVQFLNRAAYDKHLISSGRHTALNQQYRKDSKQEIRVQCRLRSKRIRLQKMEEQSAATNGTMGDNNKTRRNRKILVVRTCTVCGLKLDNLLSARFHYHKYHPDDEYYKKNIMKMHKCPVCDYSTVNPCAIYHHKKSVHSNERPFKCPYCEMTFKSKQNMQRHTSTHTGEKPYECAYCQKRFAQKVTVQLHIQTVHLKIPYPPWQNKNKKRSKEKKQDALKKTTNKRKKYSDERESKWVEQEVVEDDTVFYLEGQELANDYDIQNDLVYSTSSNESGGKVCAINLDSQTKRLRLRKNKS